LHKAGLKDGRVVLDKFGRKEQSQGLNSQFKERLCYCELTFGNHPVMNDTFLSQQPALSVFRWI
jgi:hypothetical protein